MKEKFNHSEDITTREACGFSEEEVKDSMREVRTMYEIFNEKSRAVEALEGKMPPRFFIMAFIVGLERMKDLGDTIESLEMTLEISDKRFREVSKELKELKSYQNFLDDFDTTVDKFIN